MKVSKKLNITIVLMLSVVFATLGLLMVVGGLEIAKEIYAVKGGEDKSPKFTKEESINVPPVCIERERKSFSDKVQSTCKDEEALTKGYCTIMIPRASINASRTLKTIKCSHRSKGKYFDKELTAVAVCCKYGSVQ